MANRPTKKSTRQAPAAVPRTATVELPVPLLAALEDAESGFLGLCIETGKQVLTAMMEEDRVALCGAAGRHDPDRDAVRGGSTESAVVLGGRRIGLRRPRVRSRSAGEVRLPSFEAAAAADPLDRHTLGAIAAGVSMRRYRRSLDALPGSERESAASRSAVSRRFVALSQKRLAEALSASLAELDVRVVLIDGLAFHDHSVLLALGVDSDGHKHVLGLWEGTTENAAVAKALLRDLLERGLRSDRPMLFVIDGSKALRKAVRETFGRLGFVQRCVVHKQRNVLEHLPGRLRASTKQALQQAWGATSAATARRQLQNLAASLEREHPGAAASLREGLEETLTLLELGLGGGALYRTLRSTNPIENLNGSVASYTRHVKRWRGGQMILRWVGAAVLEAKRGFRRVRGHRDMEKLIAALDARMDNQDVTSQAKAA